MPNKYIFLSVVALGALVGPPSVLAQGAAQSEAPRIFFDCQGPQCDDTYHRTEIPWVTWVRDQNDADVHVIMTSQSTGANGREYQLDVMGREAYEEYEDQTLIQSLPTDTQRERLDAVSHALGLAFAEFAQYAGYRGLVSLQATQRGGGARSPGLVSAEQVDDAWRLWVFRVGGNGSLSGEETNKSRSLSGNFSASRVTPTWKQSYRAFMNYSFRKTTFSSGSSFIDERRDWNINSTVVYSVADLWSVGFTGQVRKSTRENTALSLALRPALEFSIFPYEEATRRSITAFYEVGPVYYDYIELTRDELLSETRFQQSLTLEVSQRQTWGDVSVSVAGSHYLGDFDRNNLNLNGFVSFRITRGLDVNFGGSYTLVADQLYTPFEELTDEELLTGVRRAATNKRYNFNIGLSYQFGSIFNNVVNNRFPGGGGNFGGGNFRGGGGGFRGPF